MKNILLSIGFLVLLVSFVSPSIIINQQPNDLYNIGDVVNLPVKITAIQDTSSFFQIYLICSGIQTEVYREYVVLATGEEKIIDSHVPLIKSFVGSPGNCLIKTALGSEYTLTNEFKISDKIFIELSTEQKDLVPGETFILGGSANKENGNSVDGFIEANLTIEEAVISGIVDNGFFHVEYVLPEKSRAGQHLVRLEIYEKDSLGDKTSKGFLDFSFKVLQVPTSLEIISESSEVKPGENFKARVILYDQTGEKIESNSTVFLEDADGSLREQFNVLTNELFEIPVLYNEKPSTWKLTAESSGFTTDLEFVIPENLEIKTEIFNKTLLITNVGNVPYCKPVTVKIGDNPVNVDVCLKVDESQKYVLSAPDGNYRVEILTGEGSPITGMVSLTGKNVGVEKASPVGFIKYTIVWIFIIFVLGFVAFLILKKGYKRSFFGYAPRSFNKQSRLAVADLTYTSKKDSLIDARNRAELSLSIKGDKQSATVVCLNMKNYHEIVSSKLKDGSPKQILQRAVNMSESVKASVYENQSNIFFMFIPSLTRTFKNEKTAVDLANKIKQELNNYNRLAKLKINFGISVDYGDLVVKPGTNVVFFMSLGPLITNAKKIAFSSDGEIVLSEKMREKLGAQVKTKKYLNEKPYYKLEDIKSEKEDNQKFITGFLKRMRDEQKK